jgi:hypothetical protein
MTASCVRGRAGVAARRWLWAALLLAAVASAPAAADEPIVVRLDQARLMKLPERAATVVIGNPLIADLAIQPGGIAIVTGKGFGATNFVVMDRSGAVLMEKIVEVKGPTDPTVVVFRGETRQTYSCTPECSPRITLGDTGKDDFDKDSHLNTDYFTKTIQQSATRNTQAMSAGTAAAAK